MKILGEAGKGFTDGVLNLDTGKFTIVQRWCSHDDGETFHHDHWTCHLRAAILQTLNPQPVCYVSHVDEENGIITISTKEPA